ncbi:MAG: hypothetical protein PHO41_10375, partial [Eubacteriales bacterium]|nr:hypothetical protein [Eubacteriales bacterium]
VRVRLQNKDSGKLHRRGRERVDIVSRKAFGKQRGVHGNARRGGILRAAGYFLRLRKQCMDGADNGKCEQREAGVFNASLSDGDHLRHAEHNIFLFFGHV